MSISTNSINCGDDFIPAENGEVNVDAICLENGQEMELKMAKLELENVKKMAKLEIENKEQKLKLQELMIEQKALKEKMTKIEQEKEKNAIAADQLTKILEKISEMEKQQKQQNENTTKAVEERFSQLQNDQKIILEKITEMEKQKKQQNENTTKATSDQFSKMQNDQKILLEKISELEKRKQRKALLNFQQNYWDANFCHKELEIIGDKSLIVHYKGNTSDFSSVFAIFLEWCCSVFAVHPFLLNNNSFDIFYYEISVQNIKSRLIFGFALKQQDKLFGRMENGAYSYESDGEICINGERKGRNDKYSYGVGDTVGIGVNLATRQIILTKNGLRLGSSRLFVASSFVNNSFYPFVSLVYSGDKIEANFGPNFKFDLTTL
ncbi:hypothetical protein niasHT_000164 [Heterodera trifolii]|uniref:B30.2/SPRY domain-containing protein n=1 Tax=Heterodera trifolii TaxID=157864 RepID=A0ABD2LQ84_9BILA